jgi:hypothetical protein
MSDFGTRPSYPSQLVPLALLLCTFIQVLLTGCSDVRWDRSTTVMAQLLAPDSSRVGRVSVRIREARYFYRPDAIFSAYGATDTMWTRTHADGALTARLRVIPRDETLPAAQGWLYITAYVPGLGASWPAEWRAKTTPSPPLLIQIHPAGHVTGHVFDPHGRPLAGVSVEACAARPTVPAPWGGRVYWMFATQSDVQGFFRFDDLVAGDYGLTAVADSALQIVTDSMPGRVTVTAGMCVRQELLMIANRTLRGRVFDVQGRAVRCDTLQYGVPGVTGPLVLDREGRFAIDLSRIFYHPMPHMRPPRLAAAQTLRIATWWDELPAAPGRERLAATLRLDFSRDLPESLEVHLRVP